MPKVDLSAYEDREQAYVKHCLLEEYLPTWGYKISSAWDTLVYVDGFAGPWKVTTPTFHDSSFGVAVDALKQVYLGQRDHWKRNVRVFSVLVADTKTKARQLREFGATRSVPGFTIESVCGRFAEQIPAISRLIEQNTTNPFKFVFLDPKGWKDIPMAALQPFLRGRSCEVLVNLMTSDIKRFLAEPPKAESYVRLFGRPGVLEILRGTPAAERDERAVQEYCKSLKQLCDFKYVSSAVIFEPNREEVKYFLVFATNHSDGVQVFKAAEMNAARIQDAVRDEVAVRRSGQTEMFDTAEVPRSRVKMARRAKYRDRAYAKVAQVLLQDESGEGVSYTDLLMEALAFPLVTPDDLKDWIRKLHPTVELILEGSGKRREPSTAKNDRVIVHDRLLLAALSAGAP
jgi:three-Cys-motif partner protein